MQLRLDPAEVARIVVDVLLWFAVLRLAKAIDALANQFARFGRMVIGDSPDPPSPSMPPLEQGRTVDVTTSPKLSRVIDRLRRKMRHPPSR
jgi:hypothetical protein